MASHRLILDLHALTSNGPLVQEIQSHLVSQGFLGPQDVDGIFGPRTRGAVEAFCQGVHLYTTNRGITQRVYDDFRIRQGQPTRPVQDLEDSETRSIYHGYWAAAHADLMVRPRAVAMFDTAVNFGAHGAVEFLQEALGLPVDGGFGPQTQAGLEVRNDRASH